MRKRSQKKRLQRKSEEIANRNECYELTKITQQKDPTVADKNFTTASQKINLL